MYKKIRNPDTRVGKPISAWKPPTRRKAGQPESQDQIIDSTPTEPVAGSKSHNMLSSQTAKELHVFKYHETTQELLANSPKRRNVTVFSRDERTNPVTIDQRDESRYGQFISEYTQDTDDLETQTIQPNSGEVFPVEESESGGEYSGQNEFEQQFSDGTQEQPRNTDLYTEQTQETTSTEAPENFKAPLGERWEVKPPADCNIFSTSQGPSRQPHGASSLSLSPSTDNEFDIDDDVFGDFQASHQTYQVRGDAQVPIEPSSMAVQDSPISSNSKDTVSSPSKPYAILPLQEQISEQNDLTLQASPAASVPRLGAHKAVTIPQEGRTRVNVDIMSPSSLQMTKPPTSPGPASHPHAHPSQRPRVRPIPKPSSHGSQGRAKQPKNPNTPRPFVRPPFPRPVHDRSPIQGLTSSHTLLRTCFRIGEALIASLSPTTSAHLAPKPPKPFLPSQFAPKTPPPSKPRPETGAAAPTILIELYALVESSHRINNTQYFTFADLFFPSRPPYLAGVWEGCAANAVFDEDGRAFLGPGGREWRWDEAGRKKKKGEMERGDGCGGRKMCRVIGVIERDGKGKGGGMQGVPTLPGRGIDVVVMSVLSIWKADWSDVEYVKGVIEA